MHDRKLEDPQDLEERVHIIDHKLAIVHISQNNRYVTMDQLWKEYHRGVKNLMPSQDYALLSNTCLRLMLCKYVDS